MSQTTRTSSADVADRPSEDCFDRHGLPRRFGRYYLLRLLARGGMGEVFLGATAGVEGAERPVVVKVIRREHAKDPNFVARFLDEARVQAQLQHSGVAQVLEAATHDETGDPYVVMEAVEGRSLGNLRRRIADVGTRLRWEEAVAIGALISEALAHIHERCDPAGKPLRIVHRDLSPHNVMVGYAGEVKIIDFGTARAQNRRCHTVAGVVFAKPGYVAPEVANGISGDARVDQYAVGVMIWELCAGRRFLQEEAQLHTAAVAKGERPLPPIAHAIGAPAELDAVLAQMTAHERDDRFLSIREASSRIAQLLKDAPPLSNGERGTRARVAQLMYNLYPSQPGRGRRELARLIAQARRMPKDEPAPPPPRDSQPPELEDPDMLAGTRYRLRREIGRGASSIVYEAEHVELGRRVAIKVLDAQHTHSREFAARFRREARTLSRLHHPGLVRVSDFGQSADGRLFFVMELLEGRTLREELEIEGELPWEAALRYARQAALALEAAHRRDLVHRDIKPENIFITRQGQVKLIDFGLAKSAEELGEASDDLGGLTLFGTPEYMAPEQAQGGRIDHRADVYALGCVLYEMLTGRLPFVGESAVVILDKKLQGGADSVRERAPSLRIPRSVSRLVSKALARHPRRRHDSAGDMATAMAHALAEPTQRRARRRALGASVLAATMAFGLVLVAHQARPWLEALPAQMPWLAPGDPASPANNPGDEGDTRQRHEQHVAPAGDPARQPAGRESAGPKTTMSDEASTRRGR